MKSNLVILVIALGIGLLCGVGFVPSTITGSFNSLYPYTADTVCGMGENLILETDLNTTTTGPVVIDGNVYTDSPFTQNTLFCVNESTGGKREVTDETYAAFDKLRVKIGWGASAVIFVLSLIVLGFAWRKIGASLDKMITNPPAQKK